MSKYSFCIIMILYWVMKCRMIVSHTFYTRKFLPNRLNLTSKKFNTKNLNLVKTAGNLFLLITKYMQNILLWNHINIFIILMFNYQKYQSTIE